MQIELPLVNESQLGSRLNTAVESNRRGEFGLILAMLSADARDMAQFQFDKELNAEQKLYKKFELPAKQRLIDDLSTNSITTDNSFAFHQHGSRNYQLHQSLTPEALVIRGNDSDEMAIVLSNCAYWTKLKHKQPLPNLAINDGNKFIEQLERQRQLSQYMLALTA